MLRKKFRQEKKVILQKEEKDREIKDKGGLDLDLVSEDPDDIQLAKNIRFRTESERIIQCILQWSIVCTLSGGSCFFHKLQRRLL